MKKLYIILYVMILILFSSFVYAVDYEIATNHTTHDDNSNLGYDGGSNYYFQSQQFYLPQQITTDLISIYIATKFNTPPRFYFTIESDGSSKPSGTPIDANANTSIDGNTELTANSWNNITFPSSFTFGPGFFHLVGRHYNGSGNTNLVYWRLDTGANYKQGHRVEENGVTTVWTVQNATDLAFIIYEIVASVSTVDTPTIVEPSPADNANNNTNVTLNVTHSTVNNDVRYYLYFGSTTPLTEGDLQLYNETRTGDEHKTFLTNVTDGIYYYKWKVQNTTDGVFSGNTTQRTWTLDSSSPTVSIFSGINNASHIGLRSDNTTLLSSFIHNLTLNVTFADTNLFQTLINISNESGGTVFSILNTSITGTTANYTKVISLLNMPPQNLTAKFIATDSHTKLAINDYDIKKGLDYIRWTTEEGNIIEIESDTLPLSKSTTKKRDRYDFKFTYLLSKKTFKYRLRSYSRIVYLPDSEYTAHFVIINNKGEGNWIDFGGISKGDIIVTKIDDYNYDIEIVSNGKSSFTFSSLGGLNKKEEHYKIQLGAVIDVWVYDEENYPVQINTTATIGTQSANSTINVSGARLVNITKEITSLSLTSSGFGTEEKTIAITGKYHNLSFNMTPVSATKLYFYDENSNTLITGETFSVYLETTGFSQIYSSITTNPYTITGLDSGLYKLKASSANYPERQYLDLNISNATTTNLNIYLINSTLGSEKTFNIVDETLNPLEDVRAVFTKIINGTKTVVAEEESDFAGQTILYLDGNYEYEINFSKTNYEDKIISLEPTDSEYLITLVSTVGAYNQSVHEGIRYSFSPSNTVLNNNTKYNFTFTLNSTVWSLTNCTLRLKNGTILLNETSDFASDSCYIRIEQDTASMTTIVSEAIYELNSEFEFTVSQQYSVIYTYEGQFSLKNFLDDLSDFAMAGFDDFGRMMLALIVIFVITALAAQKTGFTNPEVLVLLVIAQVWFFSYVNWLFLDFTPIPTIAGFNLKKYIIAILMTLTGGAFIIEKFK